MSVAKAGGDTTAVIARSDSDEAIQPLTQEGKIGLLRFARNDG
jgi:hypothetical protein